jgi:hypothetical protein
MRLSVNRWLTGLSFLLGVVLFSSTPALAQDGGVRGGISVDPDQFYFGAHLETSPLVDRLYFRPNVEVGIGDDLTLIAANMEFVYKFSTSRPVNLYAGGLERPVLRIQDRHARLAGLQIRSGLYLEIVFNPAEAGHHLSISCC